MIRWVRRHRLSLAYAALWLMATVGVWSGWRNAEEIRYQSSYQAYINCNGVNELRRAIVLFLEQGAVDPPPLPDDMEPATREWLEDLFARQREHGDNLTRGRELFEPLDCPPMPSGRSRG